MRNAEEVWGIVEGRREAYQGFADRVWGMPETCYAEFRSVEEHAGMLAAEGFRVIRDVAGIPTAVAGEAGAGGPVIAILGEFDALPGLSQQAGVAEPRPVEAGGNGHGCGHNLLGAAALLAAAAVKAWLAASGLPGRVRYMGCPAEEGGAAKAFMVRAGEFSDVAAAITWHPAPYTRVNVSPSLANTRIDFTFHGRAAHASASPELGRSALDAVELMSVGVNYLREHMPEGARLHYAYLDAGGPAPNIVQHRATVRHLIRSRDLAGLRALVARVRKVAEGAALMTETRVEAAVVSAVSNLMPNTVLMQALQAGLERLGAPPFDAADREFARAIQATLTPDEIAASFAKAGLDPDPEMVLCDVVVPLDRQGEGGDGSTDVGDVSWAVPTVEAWVATCAMGTPFHTWQLTAQGKSPAAHKGMVQAAKAMAGLAVDLLRDPGLLARAGAEHAARLSRTPYECPLPPEVQPPLVPRPV